MSIAPTQGTQTDIWFREPDSLSYKEYEFNCQIRRSKRTGALIGMLFLERAHPWYDSYEAGINCDVHGGVRNFCKTTKVISIGFTCDHSFDVKPLYNDPNLDEDATYKDIDYVRYELHYLANQAHMALMTVDPEGINYRREQYREKKWRHVANHIPPEMDFYDVQVGEFPEFRTQRAFWNGTEWLQSAFRDQSHLKVHNVWKFFY